MWRLGIQELLQPVKAALFRRPALAQPVLCAPHRGRDNAAAAHPADFFAADQPAGLEDLKMLDNPGQADGKRLRQSGDRRRPLAQPDHDSPSGGIRKGMEDPVEFRPVSRGLIVNHILKYVPPAPPVKGPAAVKAKQQLELNTGVS
jgi:hypothetical protein